VIEALVVESNQTTIDDTTNQRALFVKGCPCFRQFGDERVCLNNDDVLPVNSISVDTTFFDDITSHRELDDMKSDNESMCYLLIFLDRETGDCFCVSQNRRIRIDKKDVSVSDIDCALQFVTNTEKSEDGLLCSECLYKYLRTLGEASEGYFTNSEREEVVSQYIREIGYKMASELSGVGIPDPSDVRDEHRESVSKYVKRISRSKSKWSSVILGLKRGGASKALLDLIESYRSMHRLEAVFLHQVLGLDEPSEYDDVSTRIKVMLGISDRVSSLFEHIIHETARLESSGVVNGELSKILLQSSEKRKVTERKFRELASVLREIGAHTTSQ
jgi:hypothetical protein